MSTNQRRGVLRHKTVDAEHNRDKFEDLLVFGYACKLFRDDEKASSIDQGKLLIPWMGDDSVKIDRYDARGTLFDLKVHERSDSYEGLTAEERKLEKLCDGERYFALYKDEAEEAVIKEEEVKRLNQDLNEVTSQEVTYHQVPFSYSSQQAISMNVAATEEVEKSVQGELGDIVYVPPPLLDVPTDTVVPPTLKLAKIVEKTANFISAHGTQMEIVVKAKQANNPLFQFLHFDCLLHPFYRHVLNAIRSGTYVVIDEDETKSDNCDDEESNAAAQSDDGDDYLHPSLQTSAAEMTTVSQSTDEKPLVDKTASYMARNDRNLEAIVKTKGDARFSFLDEDHALHSYYLEKLSLYRQLHAEKEAQVDVDVEPAQEMTDVEDDVRDSRSKRSEADEEIVKIERRKKAALFLHQIKVAKSLGNGVTVDDKKSEETSADSGTVPTAHKSRIASLSSDEVEIIGAIPKDRSRSGSVSWSPSQPRKRDRSRSRRRSRSRSRSRRRSRSRKSVSPERRRRHKKHRSHDRHRREKKRRHSRERSRRKSRRHRSRNRSISASRSRSRSPPVRSRSTSETPVSRISPINVTVQKLTEASRSNSGTSSPLPPHLQTVQPALAKLTEGIRAKVLAMIDADDKK